MRQLQNNLTTIFTVYSPAQIPVHPLLHLLPPQMYTFHFLSWCCFNAVKLKNQNVL